MLDDEEEISSHVYLRDDLGHILDGIDNAKGTLDAILRASNDKLAMAYLAGWRDHSNAVRRACGLPTMPDIKLIEGGGRENA